MSMVLILAYITPLTVKPVLDFAALMSDMSLCYDLSFFSFFCSFGRQNGLCGILILQAIIARERIFEERSLGDNGFTEQSTLLS